MGEVAIIAPVAAGEAPLRSAYYKCTIQPLAYP